MQALPLQEAYSSCLNVLLIRNPRYLTLMLYDSGLNECISVAQNPTLRVINENITSRINASFSSTKYAAHKILEFIVLSSNEGSGKLQQ